MLLRWTPGIVYALYLRGRMCSNELKMAFGVSSQVLSDKLKFLEKYGIVFKEIDLTSRPIRAYYSLTDLGKEIELVLVPLLVVIKEICIRRKVS
ncbi:MAG: hypothetical protein DRN04_03805 [Thermoprotei archaeon]|nr:MAG: hypothetical protein DRN04_03805 [Thermoprotei archaeon]